MGGDCWGAVAVADAVAVAVVALLSLFAAVVFMLWAGLGWAGLAWPGSWLWSIGAAK